MMCVLADGLVKVGIALLISTCSLSSSLMEDWFFDKYWGHSPAFW